MVNLDGIGPAALLHYRNANTKLCEASHFSTDGKLVSESVDAEMVTYAFLHNGYQYKVSYWRGDMPGYTDGIGPRTIPAAEILDSFVRGLKFAKP